MASEDGARSKARDERSDGRPTRSRTSEQTRTLRLSILRTTVAATLAYTAVFLGIVLLVNAFVLPRVSDIVASVTSPWRYVSAEASNVGDQDWYIQAENELKADVVRKYLHALVESSVPDASWGLASNPANAKNVQTEGADPATVRTIGGSSAANGGAGAAETSGATSAAVENADTGEFAASISQGLVQGDALTFSGMPDASAAARQIVATAVDTRNLGLAANVYDALWSLTKDWDERPEQVELYYDEASSALDADFSQMVVNYEYDAATGLETVTYAGGQQMQRDLSPYNGIRALKYPIALALFLLGILAIMAFLIRKSLGYFEQLYTSVSSVLAGRSKDVKLPAELAQAESAINDLKRKNDESARAATAAEQRKNELVTYLAHDTKTPITSITGYLTLLEEAPDMPIDQRRRYAHVALSKAYRLDAMLDEFFEITRYNVGAIPIERERFDLALFCFQVAEDFYPEADARGISIDVDAVEGHAVFADARKMARVLGNVVRNAIAYADENSTIDVRARVDDEGGFEITVANKGREISPEHLQRIFEKFYREDDARATRQGGVGLGLAIAREIVLAHGGTIEATSEAGVTTFTVKVPPAR